MADYYFQKWKIWLLDTRNYLIHDINIGINKGEIVTLIGPNGSGKSTILKSITKQLKLVGGNVFFDDTSLLEMSYKELSSNMAVVLTDRIKTEFMTCHDIVSDRALSLHRTTSGSGAGRSMSGGRGDAGGACAGALATVILMRLVTDRSSAFCWREQYLQDPDVIVLDEPTSFLDVKYKFECVYP